LSTIADTFKRFHQYIANTSWIMAEKVVQILIGLLVTIFVARYLGPQNYGILAYAVSLTAIFSAAGHLGLSGLVVREIVKNPSARAETLGTTLSLKLGGVGMGFLILCCIAFLSENFKSKEFWVVIIVASSLLFNSSAVFDFWFQAHIQSKFSTLSKVTALVLTGIFKVILVVIASNLLYFAFASVLQAAITSILLCIFYVKTSDLSIFDWKSSRNKAKELVSQGWIIFLGTIFSVIYLKIDQIMLKWLIGLKEVGIYSVASTISEAWYFVPTAIVTSFFPRLIKLHQSNKEAFNQRLQQIFDLLFILAFSIVIIVTLFAKPLITLLYGLAYQPSSNILIIHIWAAIFIFMRAAFSRWILIEDALMFSLITQGAGALVNVGLNFLLIPRYAGVGAAIATLASYAMASYGSLLLYKRTRPIFWMMTRSMTSPVRYAYVAIRGRQ
jgi:O-antigen/teichoic acid export membrane protein